MNGVLLVNKPAGITSHDTVSRIKKIVGEKTGHAGTLDPFATGLLVVVLGQATKISRFFLNENKIYEGLAVLGKKTNTYDKEGKIVNQQNASNLTASDLENAFNHFMGEILQQPPPYSALKIKGRKSYQFARKGKEIYLPKRKVIAYSLELLSFEENCFPKAVFRTKVSKGTYIRSLVNDIGDYLKTGAYLEKLCRIASGRFNIKNSLDLSAYIQNPQLIKKKLITIQDALSFPALTVKKEAKQAITNGVALKSTYVCSGSIPQKGIVKVIDRDGKILGIQELIDGEPKVLVVFK